jgi:hypothetical protein
MSATLLVFSGITYHVKWVIIGTARRVLRLRREERTSIWRLAAIYRTEGSGR